MNAISEPLWQPTPEQVASASITRFTQEVEIQWGRTFGDYRALHDWSVEQPEELWISVWDFCGILAATRGNRVLERLSTVPGPSFFQTLVLILLAICSNVAMKVSRSVFVRRIESSAV